MGYNDEQLLSEEEEDEVFEMESSRLLGENESITALLKKLQKPWISPKMPLPENHFEGWLWKKKRRTTGWSRVFCILDGFQFTWKKNESAKRVNGSVAICFLGKKDTSQLAVPLIDSKKLSKFSLDVYSPHTVLTLLSDEESTLDHWYEMINSLVQKNMAQDEYQTREQIVKNLQPLLIQKSEEDVQKLFRALMIVEQNGIFLETKLSKKDKGGRLEMWREDGQIWENLYFAIYESVLFYYRKAKQPPKGFLMLKKANIKLLGQPSSEPFLSQDDLRCQFEIETPIQTFKLRAKHDVAAEDWLSAFDQAQNGKKVASSKDEKDLSIKFTNLIDLDDEKSGSVACTISYKTERKLKAKSVYNVPSGKTSVTVGRSSNNKIHIDEDRKLSREHAKIDTKDGKVFTFYDLGSSRGSKINKVPVTKQVLQHGDVIKIGNTRMRFKVKKM